MTKKKALEIYDILKQIIVNPKPELDFNNEFELLCAVMLSAQTTDKKVNQVTKVLFSKYQTPADLKKASFSDVYEIIKPLGLANNKAKNLISLASEIVDKYDSTVPDTFSKLESLPGVGHKTASVVLALGFNIPAFPVDTHVYRTSVRLGFAKNLASVSEAEEELKKYIPKDEWIKAHHVFLLFGRYYCTSKNPKCDSCLLKEYCKYFK